MQPIRKRPNPYLSGQGFGGQGFGGQMNGLLARLLQNQQFNMPPQNPSGPPMGIPFEGGMQSPYKQPTFNPMPFEGSGPAPYAPFAYNKKRMF